MQPLVPVVWIAPIALLNVLPPRAVTDEMVTSLVPELDMDKVAVATDMLAPVMLSCSTLV